MTINVLKVFAPATLSFFFGLLITYPILRVLNKNQMWKKKSVELALDGTVATISQKLHQDENRHTPRMGGLVIWISALVTTLAFYSLIYLFPTSLIAHKLNFFSRNQTWLPLFTLLVGSLVGLLDDYLVVGGQGNHIDGGLPLRTRIIVVLVLGAIGAWWFSTKLEATALFIPFYGSIELGLWFYPIFIITMLALFSGSVIDGIDGLSGGVLVSIFSAYAGIAFFRDQIDLAAFSAAIVGGILAFLWNNIPPAKFYMSETGILGLTVTLTVVAFLTESAVVLPIIAFPLLAASGSSLLQILSKKFRGKKIFLVAPIHHHFQAKGWPAQQVTMRFWIISIISASIGMVIALIGNLK